MTDWAKPVVNIKIFSDFTEIMIEVVFKLFWTVKGLDAVNFSIIGIHICFTRLCDSWEITKQEQK